MRRTHRACSVGVAVLAVLLSGGTVGAAPAPPEPGYRGIWYMNQPQDDQYRYKYSGGLGTFPQQHVPMAVYSAKANKTFFCYGGKSPEGNRILDMVSYYDHATGRVPRPMAVLERRTNDAHYTPTLALDAAGYVYVFANCHGTGYEQKRDDPTYGRAYVYRSERPYSIDRFRLVRGGDDNFSYSQPWPVEGGGLLWLHTRYQNNRRRIFFSASKDGVEWAEPRQLADMGQGSYQVSWCDGRRVATAMDYHPGKGGLNERTNIYYLETRDFGRTWTTAAGGEVAVPLKDARNGALVHDFEAEGLLVYLKDLAFDRDGRPVILYLTAKGYRSGPATGPRAWHTARWTGERWERREVMAADHNYDHGSLYVEDDGVWRLIAPTGPGPQPHTTGGQVAVHVSKDEGRTWEKVADLPAAGAGGRNHTYVRRPFNAHGGFYGFWADGNALEPSESDLYFCTKAGEVYRLPREMAGETAEPERVGR